MPKVKSYLVTPENTIGETIAVIDKNSKGIALAVDEERRLLGTITDGDIRRAILAGRNLDVTVGEILAERPKSPYPKPLSASVGTEHSELLRLMHEAIVSQLPLLDDEGRVVGLVTLDDLLPDHIEPLHAVVMAGGFGKRLQPLTDHTPKPMLPMGDRPLMEHTIRNLRDAGINHVNVTTHYMPEKIKDHFGDGKDFGVEMEYVSEDQPLGTAGALGLMKKPDQPILVINGDILTGVDFRAMRAFHREHKADLTVGVRQYDLQVPYGVVETEGVRIQKISEKPAYKFFVNAGIYLLEPSAHGFIPSGERFDMTDLIESLIEAGRSVVSFPIIEYWLDIGQPEDYKQAQQDLENGRLKQ